MNPLHSHVQAEIKTYLQKSAYGRLYGFDQETHVRFLAQGEYNANYLVVSPKGKYVFRMNMGSQLNLDNQIEYEYAALKRLEPSGVTPKACFVDDSRRAFQQGVLMMEFLPGRPLDYRQDLEKAARIFSRIHGLDPAEFADVLIEEKQLCHDRVIEGERWLAPFLADEKMPLESKRIIGKLLEYCRKEQVRDAYFQSEPWLAVNNTEVNSHNFIIGPNHSYLIDWEKPVISDPVQDLTQFLAATTTLWKANTILSQEEVDGFYRVYGEEQSKAYNIRDRVALYEPFLLLRALSWCAGAFVEYSAGSRAIQNADTFEKIKMYLDPGFMRKLLKPFL